MPPLARTPPTAHKHTQGFNPHTPSAGATGSQYFAPPTQDNGDAACAHG